MIDYRGKQGIRLSGSRWLCVSVVNCFLMSAPSGLKRLHPLPHPHHVLRQRKMAARLNQRDCAIEVRSRMGTGDYDADRVKQLFAFGPGFVFHLIDNRFEALRAESVVATMHTRRERRND